ncbi:methyl-accepting chemotaxis protein III [Sphingomonas mucosissima]|uniref:Methyl-accepting chemotaxis protein III n=1 Tax=Sphingomonas mucosissima TaxID=370959 RepID=A0A245ZJP8_9SPHN|nr:methyl-accepting chemotaxis protein III [Sphingomonas mucosissima]
MLGVALLGSRSLDSVNQQYSVLVESKLPATTKFARINRRTTQMVYEGYQAMVYPAGSVEGKKSVEAEQEAFESAEELLRAIKKIDPASIETVGHIEEQVATIHAGAARAIQLGNAGQNEAARALLADLDVKLEEISSTLSKANDLRIKEGEELSVELTARTSSASTMMLVVSAIGIALGIGAGLIVSRVGITGPLARLQDAMGTLAAGNNDLEIPGADRGDEVGTMAKAVLVFRDAAKAQELAQADKARADAEQRFVVDALEHGLGKLAQGDLTADIRDEFSPSYVSVKSNFNDALASLRELIGSVAESTATIRTGSGEIAQASEDLARRTEANAASLEQTSAAVTQMDDRLKTTAHAAGRTVERADGAIASVNGGRAIADEAMQAMSRVSESAKGIDGVIEGLDKIAFQTRVLAMNAAVEAGRAGEAGRGFAVVADLVSALAMRAEEEAGRARDQLTATQTDIVAAVDMVQKVDSALSDISGDVTEVHTLLAQMAHDNQVQSTAISEISVAIGTMDQSTQQNAAMVEETSAAARNLSGEVATLSEQASKFNVGPGGRAAPVRSTLAPFQIAEPSSYLSPVKALAIGAPTKGEASDDWASS